MERESVADGGIENFQCKFVSSCVRFLLALGQSVSCYLIPVNLVRFSEVLGAGHIANVHLNATSTLGCSFRAGSSA